MLQTTEPVLPAGSRVFALHRVLTRSSSSKHSEQTKGEGRAESFYPLDRLPGSLVGEQNWAFACSTLLRSLWTFVTLALSVVLMWLLNAFKMLWVPFPHPWGHPNEPVGLNPYNFCEQSWFFHRWHRVPDNSEYHLHISSCLLYIICFSLFKIPRGSQGKGITQNKALLKWTKWSIWSAEYKSI